MRLLLDAHALLWWLADDGSTGGLSLLTPGPRDSHWNDADASFSSGLVETRTPLVPEDQDEVADVYTVSLDGAAQPTLLSRGEDPDAEVHGLAFAADGSRAILTTYGRLTSGDTDSRLDAYVWSASGLAQLVPGDAQFRIEGWSSDLSRIVFETGDALVPEDTNQAWDAYVSDAEVEAPVVEIDTIPHTSPPSLDVGFRTAANDSVWFDCQVDGGSFAPCASPIHLSGLATGEHRLTIRGWDAAANSDEAMIEWSADAALAVPPIATVSPLSAVSRTSFVVRWGATTGTDAVASWDVRYREARWDAGFGPRTTWNAGITSRQATFRGDAGTTVCFGVRARDVSGRVSTWTPETCTAVPLDDRSLTRRGAWTRLTDARYYRGGALRSTSAGALLTRTGIEAREVSVVVSTCRGCGSVRAYWNGRLVRTISLDRAVRTDRVVLRVISFPTVRRGTLTLRLATACGKVIVDGVAVRR